MNESPMHASPGKSFGTPLVSVIIPTFNRPESVLAAIESCIQQTYQKIEIIVVDDGSSESAAAALSPLVDAGKIRYIKRGTNAGPSMARNAGLDAATGEYIQFLDDDDLLYKGKISTQMRILQECPSLFGVCCSSDYVKGGKKELRSSVAFNGSLTKRLLWGNFIPIHAMLSKKTDLRFDAKLRKFEDWKYWLFATYGKEVRFIDEALCSTSFHVQSADEYGLPFKKAAIVEYLKLLADPRFFRYSLTTARALSWTVRSYLCIFVRSAFSWRLR